MSWKWLLGAVYMSIIVSSCAMDNKIFRTRIEICSTNIAGQQCSIVCKVPDFKSPVSFFHPPGVLVATCQDGESCKSLNNSFRLIPDSDNKHVTLLILKLNKQLHSGRWLCTYGGGLLSSAKLTVYDKPKEYYPTVYLAPYKDQHLTLICDIEADQNVFKTKWFKNDIELSEKGSSKRFLQLNDIDSSSVGRYMCSVSLIGGSYTINSSYINVYHITQRKKNSEIKPEVVNLSAEEGQSLTIGCNLYSKDDKIIWKFNDKLLTDNDGKTRIGINGNLHIANIQTSNIGRYVCQLEKENTGVKDLVIYQLIAVFKPKRNDLPTTFIHAKDRERIKLPCDPVKFNVRWKYNSNALKESSRRYITTDKNMISYLVINDFEEDDEGYYGCFDQEKDYGTAPINVYYLAYRNEKSMDFAFNLMWIAAYCYNLVCGFFCLHILSPSDYYKIYKSLFVEERRRENPTKKRIKVLKWWILMSPIFLILMFPTHVTDSRGIYSFVFPTATWILIIVINYLLYTRILGSQSEI